MSGRNTGAPLLHRASTALLHASNMTSDAAPRERRRKALDSRERVRPRVLFLGTTYAGHSTRFASLRKHVQSDERLTPRFREVSGWHHGSTLESLQFIPRAVRGRLRATMEASAFAQFPRPDVIWTSVTEVLLPFLWAHLGPLRRPLVLDVDSTWSQLNSMSEHYAGRPPRRGIVAWQAQQREKWLFSQPTQFTPWSKWAAQGLIEAGIEPQRISVIYPGVDLEGWKFQPRQPHPGPLRLLFVGGDFQRKGGDMLLDVLRGPLGDQFELDIVTRDPVPHPGRARVHRLERDDSRLSELFVRADLFVMPTRGECFGLATVEAMASGLPTLVTDIGAANEIVRDGETGWLIRPDAHDLACGLHRVLRQRECLPEMGQRARRVVETRFDAAKNHAKTVEVVLGAAR